MRYVLIAFVFAGSIEGQPDRVELTIYPTAEICQLSAERLRSKRVVAGCFLRDGLMPDDPHEAAMPDVNIANHKPDLAYSEVNILANALAAAGSTRRAAERRAQARNAQTPGHPPHHRSPINDRR